MEIKYCRPADLSDSSLTLPEASQLHIWVFSGQDYCTMDNMHKSPDSLSVKKIAHQLLNRLISLYLHIPEQEIGFQKSEHGKPYLQTDPALHFNISHTDGCIAFVFSTSSPVGIDVEKNSRKTNISRIARRTFLPEEIAHLEHLDEVEKQQYFFRCWTRTEAFLKGIGTGLSVSFTDEKIQKEYTFWTVETINVPDGYTGSVAYRTL